MSQQKFRVVALFYDLHWRVQQYNKWVCCCTHSCKMYYSLPPISASCHGCNECCLWNSCLLLIVGALVIVYTLWYCRCSVFSLEIDSLIWQRAVTYFLPTLTDIDLIICRILKAATTLLLTVTWSWHTPAETFSGICCWENINPSSLSHTVSHMSQAWMHLT